VRVLCEDERTEWIDAESEMLREGRVCLTMRSSGIREGPRCAWARCDALLIETTQMST
jgi:hypothetical protein